MDREKKNAQEARDKLIVENLPPGPAYNRQICPGRYGYG